MLFMLFRKINKYHVISILVTLCFVACSVFVFVDAFRTFIGSCVDLGSSVAYFFKVMFGGASSEAPSVTVIHEGSIQFPKDFFNFKLDLSGYWALFASKANVIAYLVAFSKILLVVIQFGVLAVPLLILFIKLFLSVYFKSINNHYGRDSKPLKLWKAVSAMTYVPVKNFVIGFVQFLKQHKIYLILWFLIWSYNLNLLAILVEFLAFYLYFAVSFDVVNLYVQAYNFVLNIQVLIRWVPWPGFVFVWLWLLDRGRKKIGYKNLEHMESRNMGFINALPISSMIVGTMGTKKTSMLTNMCLSLEVIMRDKAYKFLIDADLKFPYFPWITFENCLKVEMRAHRVYNLSSCRKYVRYIRRLFFLTRGVNGSTEWRRYTQMVNHPLKDFDFVYGYDYIRYGFEYNDGLKISNLFDVLEEYAQLYFMYVIRSSLILSNYSIRTDFQQIDAGNFPMWEKDFFRKDPCCQDAMSRHSHIIDFDMLRLGRKIVEDNINNNSFDFGIVAITEIAKERGNQFDTKELKKNTEETNQKNDMFDSWMKMCRHPSTVSNYPFIKIITDDQREQSLGANARDLCDIIHIVESSETRLALPGFGYEEMLYDFVIHRFLSFYQDYRFKRGDNTLLMHLCKTVAAKLTAYYTRIYNRFGYNVLDVETERGTQDSGRAAHKYYISHKKTYSKRFATDCFADFFADKAKSCPVGLVDIDEYKTERADADELKQQNSYFINDLYNFSNNKKSK